MILSIIVVVTILATVTFYFAYIASKNNPKNKAELFLSENRIDEAIAEFKKVIESQPNNVSILWRLAEIYFKQNKIDLAIDHLKSIIDIGKYSDDAPKENVFKLLADIYLQKGNKLRAFELFYDLLHDYPSDAEGLYHVGFLALGQELFDVAYKHLELLARIKKDNFEILFGTGIAALQCDKMSEALLLFKDALSVQPDSDIANIAMAFVLYRKADFKSAVDYASYVIDNSKDNNAVFIAKRLLAFIYIELMNYASAIKLFEELKEDCFNNGLEYELKMILYDIGFTNLAYSRNEEAHAAWNQLFLMDRSFKNIIDIITRLRQEMDTKSGSKTDQKPVITELVKWKKGVFPENFLWDICGLKSDSKMDLKTIISSGRILTNNMGIDSNDDEDGIVPLSTIDDIYKLDFDTFERVSYRLCEKLGFTIDEVMDTYRGSDGIDFFATYKDKTKTLIWIRRWKDTNIGEIPLRNFAQAINDVKAELGYFITTSPLSEAGESVLNSLEKVKVIYPEEIVKYLKGLFN